MSNGFTNGVETWAKEVNANGGINWRQIVLTKVDNQFSADGAVAACKQVTSSSTLLNLMILSSDAEIDCEDAAGIPVIVNSPADLKTSWRNVLPLSYIPAYAPAEVSFLKSSYMNDGSKKIGIIYVGDTPQLVDQYKAQAAELKSQGMDLVHSESITSNQASVVSELTRMRESGAEVVILDTSLEAPSIVRDAKAIGYAPQWFASSSAASLDLSAKAANKNYLGVLGVRTQVGTETAAFAAYVAKVKQYEGAAAASSADSVDVLNYTFSVVLGRILQLAGPDLTRASFLAAARSLDNFQDPLHLMGPFTFKGRAVGQLAVVPVECCNANFTFKTLCPPAEKF